MMNDTMNNISLLVCDDHPIFLEGLINIIQQDKSFTLLAQCADGRRALDLIKQLKPDIAILDISMPEMDGLQVVRRLQSEKHPTRIIILTMYQEEEYFSEALDAGVRGYLLKENAAADLLACIKAVAAGHYYVSALLSDYLIKREKQLKALKQDKPGIEILTEMERKILGLIAENKTSRQIAEQLFISPRTVQNHRQHISDKLNLHGPHKLLQFALENKSLL